MQRTPEPELMDAPEQAQAYAGADFSEPNQLFVRSFVDAVLGQAEGVVDGAVDERAADGSGQRRLIDLGCGPADICIRLARALPSWSVVALDAGPNMLAQARAAIVEAGLQERIEPVLAHLPYGLPDRRFDAIVSNSLLHHLPDPMALWLSVSRLARPGAFVQVMDLHRPPDQATARAIVAEHAADAPLVLVEDFFNSLLAAYTGEEIEEQLRQVGLEAFELTRPSDRHWLVQGRIGR